MLRSILIAALIAASLVWSVGMASSSRLVRSHGSEQASATEAALSLELPSNVQELPDSLDDLHKHCAHASVVLVLSAAPAISFWAAVGSNYIASMCFFNFVASRTAKPSSADLSAHQACGPKRFQVSRRKSCFLQFLRTIK